MFDKRISIIEMLAGKLQQVISQWTKENLNGVHIESTFDNCFSYIYVREGKRVILTNEDCQKLFDFCKEKMLLHHIAFGVTSCNFLIGISELPTSYLEKLCVDEF